MWQQITFTLRLIKNKVLLNTKKATYILGACIKKRGEKTDCILYRLQVICQKHKIVHIWRGQCWSLFIYYIPSRGKDAFRAHWGSEDGKIFLCHLGDVRVSPRAQSFPPHEGILLSRLLETLVHTSTSLFEAADWCPGLGCPCFLSGLTSYRPKSKVLPDMAF